jgi:hypothetical protein
MSELALWKGGVPAYLKAAGADDVTNALAGESLGGRRISIKGGVFREMVGGKEYRVAEERALNVVLIKAAPRVSRVYYSGTFAEGEAVRPSCWSSDSQKPDAEVKNPQSGACVNCPMNIKGSGQGDGRACRFQQRLAVVIEGEIEKEEVYQLVLPSTSIFGDGEKGKMPLQAYAKYLKKEDAPMSGIVTEMRFDTSVSTPKLFFKPIRPVTEEEWQVISRLKDSDEAHNAIALTVAQTDNVQREPEPVKKAAPAPVQEPEVVEEVEEIEEPKKVTPKKAAPAEDLKLDALVDAWDDD